MTVPISTPDLKPALLAAGEKLAPKLDLAQLGIDLLAAEANTDATGFETSFGTLENYLVELQQKFMTELRDKVVQAAIAETGIERMRKAGIVYLDYCLEKHALRSWFLKARGDTAVVAQGLQKQDQAYLMILGLEFKALKFAHPQAAGRLFLSLLQEAGRDEHAARQPLPLLREAVWDFLKNPFIPETPAIA